MLHPIWRIMLRMTKKSVTGTIAGQGKAAKVRGIERCELAEADERRGLRYGLATGFILAGILGALLASGGRAMAQTKLGPEAPVTYANKYEVYGGLNFMNFQAGQDLPKRMNLGGGEIEGTYWVTKNWGATLDYRGEAGTTPVFSNAYGISRPLVYMNMGMAGAQYRWLKNQYAALNVHCYGGYSHGVFDGGTTGNGIVHGTTAGGNAVDVGLYSNRTSPIFALGGSLDFNRSKNWAVRLSPDLILEHFGTETREFFAISGGVMYRIGKK
jgi:hypothetical protein